DSDCPGALDVLFTFDNEHPIIGCDCLAQLRQLIGHKGTAVGVPYVPAWFCWVRVALPKVLRFEPADFECGLLVNVNSARYPEGRVLAWGAEGLLRLRLWLYLGAVPLAVTGNIVPLALQPLHRVGVTRPANEVEDTTADFGLEIVPGALLEIAGEAAILPPA